MLITRTKSVGLLSKEFGEEPLSLFLQAEGHCVLNIVFKRPFKFDIIRDGNIDSDTLIYTLKFITGQLGHIFCSGISPINVENASCTLPKSLMEIPYPFTRYQSTKCEVFYECPNDNKENFRKRNTLQCKHCKYVVKSIAKSKKRKAMESPDRKYKRQRLSSNFPIKYLSPKSKTIRISRIKNNRTFCKQKVAELKAQLKLRIVNLNNESSTEMSNVVKIINENFSSTLEESFNSTTGQTRDILKASWESDSIDKHLADQKDFFSQQEKSLTSHTHEWNAITLRIALAVCSRSPAAYEALRSFKILNLPSVSTLKEKTRKLNHKPGVNEDYLAEEQTKYEKLKIEKESKGESIPTGTGIVIFDEVKVIDKIMWNSKTHEFVGFAMDQNDWPELIDIYKDTTAQAPSPTHYILQYLWRDLTSGVDVIGPYFTSARSFQQKTLVTTLYQTLEAFELYNFKIVAILCDGAAENLAVMKITMGVNGAFGFKVKDNGARDFSIDPSFDNPFSETPRVIHWIICPSHQLKNLVGQLHASREDGPKNFSRNGASFGWNDIEDVYLRDEKRTENGQMRVARHLLKSYIVRDAWTRLNVSPSKVLQQEEVMSELYGFAHGETSSKKKRDSANETYNYLRACNHLFENGTLRAQRVEDMTSKVIKSMEKGFTFFENWLNQILDDDPNINLQKSQQEVFLSWQTWDLLRVMFYGFMGLAKEFFKLCPGYFLSFIRITGSAIESLFSQIKYAAGGKITSASYVSGRKAVTIRRNVQGKNISNKFHRDHLILINEADITASKK